MKQKRKRIFTSPAERARRIEGNFKMYADLKKALENHDFLDSQFEEAVSKKD